MQHKGSFRELKSKRGNGLEAVFNGNVFGNGCILGYDWPIQSIENLELDESASSL